nr:MAG TPA: hypothetical protein [Caudoviricetes sp.]
MARDFEYVFRCIQNIYSITKMLFFVVISKGVKVSLDYILIITRLFFIVNCN